MSALLLLGASLHGPLSATGQEAPRVNSIGLAMVPIKPGSFLMGRPDPDVDSWDERPVRRVTISRGFLISESEITVEQFQRFRPEYVCAERHLPSATGMSWHDATAFCEWLSEKEGKPFRLPTEAEWEYACRAGTDTPYASGAEPPAHGEANPWGVKNAHTGAREWCLDWYGPYSESDETDPVGPSHGIARVVRGGSLDAGERYRPSTYYARSANRAAIAPGFAAMPEPASGKPGESGSSRPGNHPIGFRVVQAPLPPSRPAPHPAPFVRQCVKQTRHGVTQGPDPDKPWYRKRPLMPVPPDNCGRDEIAAAGLPPAFMAHNHSPGLEVCPNGDVLCVIYTSAHEYEPEVSLLGLRLRFGADQWDMPDLLFDFPDVNDHAPCLWTDGDALHLFWGNPHVDGGYPFQWISSTDSGGTWSEIRFPPFTGEIGPHSRQPINTAFRDAAGAIYLASDGEGQTSVLWTSRDDGRTWLDTRGRSAGRHTTYALLKDGSLLGMGGKNTDLEGYMPRAVSRDGGRTWKVTRTPFAAQSANQRPCVLRLKSGRLFFCGDFQNKQGTSPKGITERGSYVALSEDDGQTWRIKKLAGALPHESDRRDATLGYSVARQAPNGVIHLMTTMNDPCLHFELNEAWILSEAGELPAGAGPLTDVTRQTERWPSGAVRATWGAGRAPDGRMLLDGAQTFHYEDGTKQWEASYQAGRKTGRETYWSSDGKPVWAWDHQDAGAGVWMQWWPNGNKKSESSWRQGRCHGVAKSWDQSGKPIHERRFDGGRVKDRGD